jgi:uncharacterized protein
MEQELLPLSEAKTRLHDVIRHAEERDLILLRHGRPVGALLGYRRYRALLERPQGQSSRGTAGTIFDAHRTEIERICRRHHVTRLSVFGSVARGEDEPASDIDLLVEFSPMPPADRSDAYFGLQADLARLLGREVDLLEESSVANPYLERAIAQDRAVVYAAA